MALSKSYIRALDFVQDRSLRYVVGSYKEEVQGDFHDHLLLQKCS